MPRIIRLAAAQVGAVHRDAPRQETLARLIRLLEDAASKGAQVVLFPECTLTTFFPRHLFTDPAELDSYFERGDVATSPNTKALFDKAEELGVDISVGFAEKTEENETYNTQVYYHAASGSILSKYRKIHLPGTSEPFANPNAINQLEKRYFKPGNLGFNAFRVPDIPGTTTPEKGEPIFGMLICNDRRWPEAWRCLGLQGVEVVMCGYNTPGYAPDLWGASSDISPEEAEERAYFQHKLSMQANSYMNACFSVSAARCGFDDGKFGLIGGSCITDPEGKIIAESKSIEDEVIIADCDLDLCIGGQSSTFDFARHRRVEAYSRIVEQVGVVEPPRLDAPESNGDKSHSTPGDSATVKEEPEATLICGPVSGPSSTKPIRILLINPNSTTSMTQNCLSSLQPTLPPDVSVHGFTAPPPAPSAIESATDNVLSAAASLPAILPLAEHYDAFLVACFSDHALIPLLREALSKPVIGIMEASFLVARTLGSNFGILSVLGTLETSYRDAVRKAGLEGWFAGVESCELGVLGLEEKGEVVGEMCGAAKRLVGRGADTICLGCAGMVRLKGAVEEAVGGEVQVVDGVVAGVQHLVGVVRMGGRTAKKGVYRGSGRVREV